MNESKCSGMKDFDNPAFSKLERQKAVCNECPVKTFCLNYALLYNEKGFWAGTTEKDRRTLQPKSLPSSSASAEIHSTSEWLNVSREFDRPTLDIPKMPSLARIQAHLKSVDLLFA